ncbi:PIN domain-containing protein, partial [Nocardia salmonicida]
MSVSEIAPEMPVPAQAGSGSEALSGSDVRRVLLVWDAPNLDMGLGAILGGRPTAAYRPRFDALGRWLLARTADISVASKGRIEAEATVFTNIAPGTADVVRPWVEALRNVGFAVFAKPKIDEDSDVDADMLAHIATRQRDGGLAGIMVASADGQAFREPLEAIAAKG